MKSLSLKVGITEETCCRSSNFMEILLIQREGVDILGLLSPSCQSPAGTSYGSNLTGILLAKEPGKCSLQWLISD